MRRCRRGSVGSGAYFIVFTLAKQTNSVDATNQSTNGADDAQNNARSAKTRCTADFFRLAAPDGRKYNTHHAGDSVKPKNEACNQRYDDPAI